MTFVNEQVPEKDVVKYGLKELNFKLGMGISDYYYWTIDRERDIYLRYVLTGRESDGNLWLFSFYWKGTLLEFDVRSEGGGIYRGPGWRKYSTLRMSVPNSLESQRGEILADLKEALIAFKDLGWHSLSTEMTITFEF